MTNSYEGGSAWSVAPASGGVRSAYSDFSGCALIPACCEFEPSCTVLVISITIAVVQPGITIELIAIALANGKGKPSSQIVVLQILAASGRKSVNTYTAPI